MNSFAQRHAAKIVAEISCLDRVIVKGILPELCHPGAMAYHLIARGIQLYDYPKWAEPLHNEIRDNAEQLAKSLGIPIHFIREWRERKEDLVQAVLKERGTAEGLVTILSAMERCPTYRPQRDRTSGKRSLRKDMGKCLHYYFYFINEELGLCYLRVPTWAPFGLQFYFNGHNALERLSARHGLEPMMIDNALVQAKDYGTVQSLADTIIFPKHLHEILNHYAALCCPPAAKIQPTGYHWSLSQVEYATDLVFTSQAALAPLYDALVRTSMLAVKAEQVSMFLGRKLHPNFQQALGSDFRLQVEGRRIMHHMGAASIKMYDKFGFVLRIETTTNDVSFFRHHRRVEHRDGTSEMKTAGMRKTIYSLPDLTELMAASNRRYLEFLATIDDPSPRLREVEKLARPANDAGGRSSRGFNLFAGEDLDLFQALLRGEFALTGLRNRDLRRILGKTGHQVSHLLKRLRLHGLLKKIGGVHKYYLTQLGRRVVAAALRLRQALVIPALVPQREN